MYGLSYCWMAKPQVSGILFPPLSTWTFLASSTTWSQVSRSRGSLLGIFSPAALNRSVFTNSPTLVEPWGRDHLAPVSGDLPLGLDEVVRILFGVVLVQRQQRPLVAVRGHQRTVHVKGIDPLPEERAIATFWKY